jgi:hypothetical protein
LAQDLVVLFATEDGTSEEKVMENNANRKDVADWLAFSCRIFYVYYLWGHEPRGTASGKQILFLVGRSGQPEIAK